MQLYDGGHCASSLRCRLSRTGYPSDGSDRQPQTKHQVCWPAASRGAISAQTTGCHAYRCATGLGQHKPIAFEEAIHLVPVKNRKDSIGAERSRLSLQLGWLCNALLGGYFLRRHIYVIAKGSDGDNDWQCSLYLSNYISECVMGQPDTCVVIGQYPISGYCTSIYYWFIIEV